MDPYLEGRVTISPQRQEYKGQATAGMVLGILSIPFFWGGLITLSLITLGIVFSSMAIAHNKPAPGMAIAGLACAIVGAIGYLIFGIATLGVGFVV